MGDLQATLSTPKAVLSSGSVYLSWMTLFHILSYPVAIVSALIAASVRPFGLGFLVGLVLAGIAWAVFNKLGHDVSIESAKVRFAAKTRWIEKLCEKARDLQLGKKAAGLADQLQSGLMELLHDAGPISWIARFALRQVGAGIVVTISDEIAKYPDKDLPPVERLARGIRDRLIRERKKKILWLALFTVGVISLGTAGVIVSFGK